jgi:hypothetical protein
MKLRSQPLVVLTAVVVVAASGCGEGSRGVALLTPPPPERMPISTSQLDKPFAQIAGAPSARSRFTVAEAGYAIEVQDLLVGPAQKTVEVDVPGAAVFEVRDGAGSVTIGNRTETVTMGATFTASEGDKLRIEAHGGPLILRAHIFKSQ